MGRDPCHPGPVDDWAGLSARFEWRPSQRHLLDLAGHVHDGRWHLCAPPGSGKTLIGMELARRTGGPTLVLAPTMAIRDQWRAATAMFGADPATFTSDDPDSPAPLVAVTYQLLGNPGEAAQELRRAARQLWVREVGAEFGDDAAGARIAAVEAGDPERARREVGRHVRSLRRSLATGADVGVARQALLGERAGRLVERFAQLGIKCVVLDECHHLLDWWALVVGALVERLAPQAQVAVVGLTATLPDPDSAREAENYRGLLGDVDAELHLAPMVAEGAVAAWRDGLRLTTVTPEEARFLDGWTHSFTAELDEQLRSEAFVGWAVAQVGGAAADARGWDAFWDRDPLAAAALTRWWGARDLALPAAVDPPAPVEGELDFPDRLVLLDAWLHDPQALVQQSVRDQVAKVANSYGVTFTTGGVRWGRSVADLVCARSSAKGSAAADVLRTEAARRGERLRALVVVERDRATTPPAAAREVLGEDAGTAARVLAALCARQDVAELGVIGVTGRGAWADAIAADAICAAMNLHCSGTGRWVSVGGCDIKAVVRLAGQGPGWSASGWLAAAEAAMDDGAARVLVSTRGLVGEGWDYPALNVMVDLSEVATSTATTQLRGRAIRLDPADPNKLVSLWDVAVAHPSAPGDWERLRRRHARWWGPDGGGRVVTGPAKLHPLAGLPAVPLALDPINDDSARAVADEEATRLAWAAVDPAGAATTAVHLRSRRRRQVRTRSRHWPWLAAGAAASGATGAAAAAIAVEVPEVGPLAGAAVVLAVVLAGAIRGRKRGERETLEALAEAVLRGLVAAGDRELAGCRVTVEPDPAGGWVATIAGGDDDAAKRWADALAEALGPLASPRWMVAAGGRAWRVPLTVGASGTGAEAFVRAFRSRVPGARLVRAGTPEATQIVLAAERQRSDEVVRSLAWR